MAYITEVEEHETHPWSITSTRFSDDTMSVFPWILATKWSPPALRGFLNLSWLRTTKVAHCLALLVNLTVVWLNIWPADPPGTTWVVSGITCPGKIVMRKGLDLMGFVAESITRSTSSKKEPDCVAAGQVTLPSWSGRSPGPPSRPTTSTRRPSIPNKTIACATSVSKIETLLAIICSLGQLAYLMLVTLQHFWSHKTNRKLTRQSNPFWRGNLTYFVRYVRHLNAWRDPKTISRSFQSTYSWVLTQIPWVMNT
jgi:hypothetical protein